MGMTSVNWGGALTVYDLATKTQVKARAFGTFEGTLTDPDAEGQLRVLVLQAVQQAATQQRGPVLSLATNTEAVAEAAMANLAPQLQALGAEGSLKIVALNFDPSDVEKLEKAAAKKS